MCDEINPFSLSTLLSIHRFSFGVFGYQLCTFDSHRTMIIFFIAATGYPQVLLGIRLSLTKGSIDNFFLPRRIIFSLDIIDITETRRFGLAGNKSTLYRRFLVNGAHFSRLTRGAILSTVYFGGLILLSLPTLDPIPQGW